MAPAPVIAAPTVVARMPAPTPRRDPLAGFRIMIDPGHGGKDPGAIAPNGLREKDVALEVSLELRARLVQ